MLVFYGVAFLTSGIILLILRRQACKDSLFLRMLALLMGINLIGVITAWRQTPLSPVVILVLQLAAWGIFLWVLPLDRRWLAGILFSIGLLFFIPALPVLEIITWGLVTAVSLAAFLLNQEQSTPIPIFAPTKKIPFSPSDKIMGELSPTALLTQKPVLECLTTGIIVSGINGVIDYANQAAGSIVGVAPVNLVGHPVADILTHLPMLASAPSNSQKPSGSFELNGRMIQGRMTLIYDDSGAVQGTVATLRDITSEYYAESSRDHFLTTVSHELRTPLTAIKGYVELLASGAGGELSVTQQHFLQTVQRNVTRMVQLINSLIFASAVKGGRLEFSTGHTNLPQLIQQICREKTPIATESGQQITYQINGRFPAIQADPIHIAIILEELIGNALKYNKQGGVVHIEAYLQTDEANHNQFAIIAVSDEGMGVTPEQQAHIFDDFFHLDMNDTQIRAGGMGMGLSVVRSLIDAYNGCIWLESAPHAGSTFLFLLPIRQLQTSSSTQPT